ncbi:MAG: hypothetical protein OQK82_02655 [Candidatus Pacearchaeota archaeon]|nr:hypothetical protein [Candidatus Pacearchaeota archaeon]
MAERYIGIENELISFKNGQKVSFSGYFDSLKSLFEKRYDTSGSSMRTNTGHGFYVDESEIEILTPPIALNEGFASRLTDSLIIGRDKVIESTPNLEHTGYSMHWNLSYNNSSADRDSMYEAISIPFQLFGLTPLSKGFNLRGKDWRYEILGDSLIDENQINATALLLGSSLYALEESERTPLKLPDFNFYTGQMHKLFIPDGRYDNVNVNAPYANFTGEMQVQQYLELFYNWIKPFVKKLGTENEVQNLESFVFKETDLEFDRFKYFAYVKENGINDGMYLPVNITASQKSNQLLKRSGTKRELPLENKLLGAIVERLDISEFNWNKLHHHDEGCNNIEGIGEIYRHLSERFNELPRFNSSLNLQDTKSEKQSEIVVNKKISYQPNQDFSIKDSPFMHNFVIELKNSRPLRYARNLVIASLIAGGISWVGSSIYNYFEIDNHVDNLVNTSEVVSQNE